MSINKPGDGSEKTEVTGSDIQSIINSAENVDALKIEIICPDSSTETIGVYEAIEILNLSSEITTEERENYIDLLLNKIADLGHDPSEYIPGEEGNAIIEQITKRLSAQNEPMEEDPLVSIVQVDLEEEPSKVTDAPSAEDVPGIDLPSIETPPKADVPSMIGGTSDVDYGILGLDDQEDQDLQETLPADENTDDGSISIDPPSEVVENTDEPASIEESPSETETVDQLPKVVLNLPEEDKEKTSVTVFQTMLEELKKAKTDDDFMVWTGHIIDPVHFFTAVQVNLETDIITENEAVELTEKCKEKMKKLKLKKRLISRHLKASQNRDHVTQSMGVIAEKTAYELCLENLEAFADNLSTEHLENIFNTCKNNPDERAILYSIWIKDFLENGKDDQIFGNLHMFLETTPDFKKDLPMIIDLLPNLNKKKKEKMLRELGLMEGEVEDVPEYSKDEIKKFENNFFVEGERDRGSTQFERVDGPKDDKPFYIDEPEEKSEDSGKEKSEDGSEDNSEDNSEDTPKKTQSRLRNSLLTAAGLLAVVGIGYSVFNNLEPSNTKENPATLSSTNTGSEGSVGTPGEKAPSENPAIAANPEDATAQEEPDATAQEEPDAATQEEPDATTQDADKEDKAPAIANADIPAIPKIPFLKEKSMEIPVSTKITEYGDTVVDFDTSLENWEEDGWEKLEAFHHSPTKQGWILRKGETVVFVLQQLLELDQTKILAYIQPKTW